MTMIFSMLLRAKKLIIFSFLGIFAVLLLLLAIKPGKYQAHMSFLVRNERAESLVSADPSENAVQQSDVTEERINSEVELLGSTELLQAVVKDNGLDGEFLDASKSNKPVAMEKATRKLSKHLDITGVRKSAVIEVTYTSSNRDEAKRVLDSLSREYLSQYAKLHNAGGVASFYRSKSEALETSLQQAENQRAALLAQNGYMLLPEGQHLGLEEIVDLQKSGHEAAISLADTESRLEKVQSQQRLATPRIETQEKTSANQYSVEQLNTKLVDLQNRRTELRTKFVDGDPLLVQVDQEISDTKTALNDAQGMHSKDTTSDVNPIREALDSEANQLSQTRAGLISRLTEINRQLEQEKNQLGETEHASIDVDNLNRNIKVLQESVDMYRTKALAASAAEELDPEKFSNVVEATHPTVPVLPASSGFNLLTAFLFAAVLSLGIGLASEWRSWSVDAEERFPMFETAGRS